MSQSTAKPTKYLAKTQISLRMRTVWSVYDACMKKLRVLDYL